jgi:hypothetical protein
MLGKVLIILIGSAPLVALIGYGLSLISLFMVFQVVGAVAGAGPGRRLADLRVKVTLVQPLEPGRQREPGIAAAVISLISPSPVAAARAADGGDEDAIVGRNVDDRDLSSTVLDEPEAGTASLEDPVPISEFLSDMDEPNEVVRDLADEEKSGRYAQPADPSTIDETNTPVEAEGEGDGS